MKVILKSRFDSFDEGVDITDLYDSHFEKGYDVVVSYHHRKVNGELVAEKYQTVHRNSIVVISKTVCRYEIMQAGFGCPYKYMPFNHVLKDGYRVSIADYKSAYEGDYTPYMDLTRGASLGALYTKFNIGRPEDFFGHPLSVSDIIVLHFGNRTEAHYVDSKGFQYLKDFYHVG